MILKMLFILMLLSSGGQIEMEKEKEIEEIRNQVNEWSIESLRELASQLDCYADCLEEEQRE